MKGLKKVIGSGRTIEHLMKNLLLGTSQTDKQGVEAALHMEKRFIFVDVVAIEIDLFLHAVENL